LGGVLLHTGHAAHLFLEHASGVHEIPPLGPGAAKVGFGWAPILAEAAMEAAGHTVIAEEAARRDHLRLDGVLFVPLGLAEVG
jgi:hypothetical protein